MADRWAETSTDKQALETIGSTSVDVDRSLPEVTDEQAMSSTLDSAAQLTKTGHEIEDYVIVCMLSVLALTGVGGNIVVLNVFSRRTKRDRACPGASATLYVLALAVADLVTCVVVIPFTVYMEYVAFRMSNDFMCKFYQFLITSNVPFSSLVMVAIAVDRYICICHPLRQATLATHRRARGVVLLLAGFAAVLGVCVALMFGVYHRINGGLAVDAIRTTSADNWPTTTTPTANTTEQFLADDDKNAETLISPFASSYFETSEPTKSRADVGLEQNLVTNGSLKSRISPGQVGDHVTSASAVLVPIPPLPISSGLRETELEVHGTEVINTGYCGPNTLILDYKFQKYYQDFHTMMYLLCILTVSILYGLIYRSVLTRRARRQRLRSRAVPLPVSDATVAGMSSNQRRLLVVTEWFRMSVREHPSSGDSVGTLTGSVRRVKTGSDDKSLAGNGHNANVGREEVASRTDAKLPLCQAKPNAMLAEENDQQQSAVNSQRNSNRLQLQSKSLLSANRRTAAILFVVTVVFVVTYTPAFLMSLELVPYQRTLFYLYFVNSVSNPVIYSFMNRYFRQQLRAIVCRAWHANKE